MHRPRSDSPQNSHSQNIYQIRMYKQNARAQRIPPIALLERWPQVCCVKITFTLLPTNHFVSATKKSKKCVVNQGRVGYFSNECGLSLDSSLQYIDFFVVETKRFVSSSVNVILMWQTCGQRSSRATESKRRALKNYSSKRICYVLLISKCRGDWCLGLCTFWILAKRKPIRSGDLRGKKRVLPAGKIVIWLALVQTLSSL